MDKNAALGQPFVPQLQTVVNEDSPWDAIPMLLPCHAGDHRHIGPQLSCTPPTLLWCCPFSNRQSSQDGGLVWPQRLKELLTLRHPGKLVVESIGSPLVDRSQRPPQLGRRDRVGRPTEDATDICFEIGKNPVEIAEHFSFFWLRRLCPHGPPGGPSGPAYQSPKPKHRGAHGGEATHGGNRHKGQRRVTSQSGSPHGRRPACPKRWLGKIDSFRQQ